MAKPPIKLKINGKHIPTEEQGQKVKLYEMLPAEDIAILLKRGAKPKEAKLPRVVK